MGKLVRYEFVGTFFDRLYIFVACLTVVFIPLAVMRWWGCLVRIDEQVDAPNAFMEAYRSGRVGK